MIDEIVGNSFEHIGIGDHFLRITPVTQTPRAMLNKWDLLKLRSLCEAKNMIKETKWQLTVWEKVFTNPTSDRRIISEYIKNSRI